MRSEKKGRCAYQGDHMLSTASPSHSPSLAPSPTLFQDPAGTGIRFELHQDLAPDQGLKEEVQRLVGTPAGKVRDGRGGRCGGRARLMKREGEGRRGGQEGRWRIRFFRL